MQALFLIASAAAVDHAQIPAKKPTTKSLPTVPPAIRKKVVHRCGRAFWSLPRLLVPTEIPNDRLNSLFMGGNVFAFIENLMS
jgi:hypothetical protein